MKTKLFNVTKEEFNILAKDTNVDFEYLGNNIYQVFFNDNLGNLIACHIYKVEE